MLDVGMSTLNHHQVKLISLNSATYYVNWKYGYDKSWIPDK